MYSVSANRACSFLTPSTIEASWSFACCTLVCVSEWDYTRPCAARFGTFERRGEADEHPCFEMIDALRIPSRWAGRSVRLL